MDARDSLKGGDKDVDQHKVASGSKRKRGSDELDEVQWVVILIMFFDIKILQASFTTTTFS